MGEAKNSFICLIKITSGKKNGSWNSEASSSHRFRPWTDSSHLRPYVLGQNDGIDSPAEEISNRQPQMSHRQIRQRRSVRPTRDRHARQADASSHFRSQN